MQVEESPSISHKDIMNFVFANSSKDDAIYPLVVSEIADDCLQHPGSIRFVLERDGLHSLHPHQKVPKVSSQQA